MTKSLNECNLDSLFSRIQDIFPEGVFTGTPLDSFYSSNQEFLSKYGNRAISNFLNRIVTSFWDDQLSGLTNEGYMAIKIVLSDRYKTKWSKLYELSNKEYDPLSPFDITLKETTTNSLNVTEDTSESSSLDSAYAYNSEEPQPTDKSENSSTNTYSRENPSTRDYTRKGNIGNTSRQELIEKEREVLKYQIIDVIYKDIATVLCRGKYIL